MAPGARPDATLTWNSSVPLVPGGTDPVGRPTAEQFTYTVEVEDGIDTVDFGGDDSVDGDLYPYIVGPPPRR